MKQADGSLQPTGRSMNPSCLNGIFEFKLFDPIAGVQITNFEAEYEPLSTVQIFNNDDMYEAAISRMICDGQMDVTVIWAGQQYEAIRPKANFLSRFLRSCLQSHYSLTNRQQHFYLATVFGEAANFLLQDANCPALPGNYELIILLLAIAAQRMEKAGRSIDLTRGPCRMEILKVLREVLLEARREQKTEAQVSASWASARTPSRSMTRTQSLARSFKSGAFTFKSRIAGRAVSAEEVQCTLAMLRRTGRLMALEMVRAAAAVIRKEQMESALENATNDEAHTEPVFQVRTAYTTAEGAWPIFFCGCSPREMTNEMPNTGISCM